MPTATQKAKREASRAAKELRLERYRLQAKLASELTEMAVRSYACGCAYCQYRSFCVMRAGKDPGPNPVEAPVECAESFTVRCRNDGLSTAKPEQAVTRNRHQRRALAHAIRGAK